MFNLERNVKLFMYKDRFESSFDKIVNEILKKDEENPELTSAANCFRNVLKCNATDGKNSRGMMVVLAVDMFREGKPTEEEVKKAICLGWCMEILQAAFLIADDIMDRSEIRRGRPCWYKQCGLIAINETYLLKQAVYKLIDVYFNEDTALKLYRSIHSVVYSTVMGQELDMLTSDAEKGNLDLFTVKNYRSIVKHKTSYYSFYLPVLMAMHVVDFDDPKALSNAEVILLNLGEFFQIQDDYLDCYGDPAVMGKVGRDIEDGKCSWLVVQALKRVTAEESEILKQNYGKDDEKSVRIVKELYRKLDLETVYNNYEEESYKYLRDFIKSNSKNLPMSLFLFLVSRIYKRDK